MVLSTRRQLTDGRYADVIANVDFGDTMQQQAIIHYFHTRRPIVAMVSPPSNVFVAGITKEEDLPCQRLCGTIAAYQMLQRAKNNDNSTIIAEQTFPKLSQIQAPWPAVLSDTNVQTIPYNSKIQVRQIPQITYSVLQQMMRRLPEKSKIFLVQKVIIRRTKIALGKSRGYRKEKISGIRVVLEQNCGHGRLPWKSLQESMKSLTELMGKRRRQRRSQQ